MKRKTKVVALLFALLLVCTVFVGCGGSNADDPIVGTWELTGVEAAGQTLTIEQFMQASGSAKTPTFEFTGDNKVNVKDLGTVDGSGEWEVKDGKYTVTDSSGTAIECSIVENKLEMEVSSIKLTFEKK